jgi:hypothetical protein
MQNVSERKPPTIPLRILNHKTPVSVVHCTRYQQRRTAVFRPREYYVARLTVQVIRPLFASRPTVPGRLKTLVREAASGRVRGFGGRKSRRRRNGFEPRFAGSLPSAWLLIGQPVSASLVRLKTGECTDHILGLERTRAVHSLFARPGEWAAYDQACHVQPVFCGAWPHCTNPRHPSRPRTGRDGSANRPAK